MRTLLENEVFLPNESHPWRCGSGRFVFILATFLLLCCYSTAAQSTSDQAELNDAHFHLTNYIQQGTDIHDFLAIMGSKVGRVALFGIPLQQQWSYRNSGDSAPTYYLETDAPLYYYSFTDAHIAMAYRSLSVEQQARFDPMITGFNPSDMYAVDHIRRVLQTFPGVFSGIGEFTIHKEFVSSKIPGETASLTNPALDRILDFAAQVGLVVLIHNDVDVPFSKDGAEPVYLAQMKSLLKRHPNNKIIWAHCGVGRVVRPVKQHIAMLESILSDPEMRDVYFDISWDEVAKYIVASPESVQITSDLINRHPDRFLFGTDEVAPSNQERYLRVYYEYEPLWRALSPEARENVRKGNYERLFDEARRKVRAWEAANPKETSSTPVAGGPASESP
jgi:predicted TIM-barrel fold metal-dependent hydrolase